MVDYVSLAATATRLITENGRAITIVAKSTTPADSSKPWRGPTKANRTEVPTTGVFVSAVSDTELGQLFALASNSLTLRGQKFVMLPAAALTENVDYGTVEDGSQVHSIEVVQPFKPGGTLLFWFLELKA